MNEQEIQNLWDSFLSIWSIENVQKMTLEQYIQVGSKDTFTYWLEHTTRPIADIRGGDASKFGIFHRRDQQDKENGRGRIYDNEYCWFQKFGDTKEQAFQTIKNNILNVINAITNNEFEKIPNIPVSEMFKWKIAFLYQNQKKPQIISIFSKTMLDFLTEDKKLNYVESYQHLLRNKGEQSILSYSDQLVNEYFEANPKQSFLTPSEADEILNIKYPDQYKSRQKMTVVTNDMGREIALVLTGSKANFFIECDPENNTAFNFRFCKKKDGSDAKYAENDTRHSNLNALSEHLKYGNKAYRIEVETADDLEKLCEWYELDAREMLAQNELVQVLKKNEDVMNQPLNRILFGAAGTGKTFTTANHALSIIENKSLEELGKETREELKKRFDGYKEKGQIKFVTFHQSFSYEDFVEGIRAETVEDNDNRKNIEYPVISGVFKSLCDIAQSKVILESQKINFDSNVNEIWKMSLGRAGEDEDIFDYCVKNHCVLLGWGDDLDFAEATNRKQVEDIMDTNGYEDYRKKYPSASRFVNDFKNKTKIGDLVIISDGNQKFRAIGEISGDYELLLYSDDAPRYVQKKSVKWLKLFKPSLNVEQLFNKVLSQQTIYNLANAINITKLTHLLDIHQKQESDKKFVLIIDEINRGNISRIFGELITLIEESKRTGEKEELSVTLPYSKQEFTVPQNVYIIGTMNSSDRSLTGLDIALRRRFTFIEMPPRPELLSGVKVQGVDIEQLLAVINQRIEVLLDRDHCIGHANFMHLKEQPTLNNLSDIFKQKIIPQLQEYFFDDWAKINLVLNGNGMLKSKPIEKSAIFPNVDSDELGYFEDKKAWVLVPTSFDDIVSFTKIIQH
ncbi:AAA family ATPase [Acinetobacter johnsonii]|uniref:AAA family ATPase n=1 Tax=Acinetobacter johnsonii TaxID=40214 RepID=UPI00244ACCA3|nr:AAA family ATPase [Acinetobacter johnsonii]MDH1531861.1 AAA family ATPase [Acinetobacter johnsonii]